MNCLLALPQSGELDNRYIYPVGICIISAVLKGLPGIRTINLNLNTAIGLSPEALHDLLEREDIHAVLSGGLSGDLDSVRRIFRLSKQYNPNIITVTGGPLVSGDPVPAMAALQFADYGILGEGEKTVAELCLALKEGADTSEIKGLVIKTPNGAMLRRRAVRPKSAAGLDPGECRLTAPRELITDWGEIPWPDYEGFGFDPADHRPDGPTLLTPVNYSTSRGCPFKCTFCHNSHGARYRPRPLEDFFRELSHRVATWGPHRVSIADDLLADSWPRLRDFCAGMKKLGLKGWLISLRVPQITPKTVDLLLESGCGSVCLGLESASDRILKSMNKGITRLEMEKALATLNRARLSFQGFFIFGDPEETLETARETLDWWRAHPEYTIGLGFIWLFPGSRLYRLALERGLITDPAAFMENILEVINISKIRADDFEDFKQEVYAAQSARYQDPRHHLLDMACDYDYYRYGVGLSGVCRYCGRPVKIRAHVGSYNPVRFCPHCGSLFYYPDLAPSRLNPDRLGRNLQALLDRYGEVAFWGLGRLFRLNIGPEIAARQGVRLIDRHAEGRYGAKAVEKPEILAGSGIKCVIVAVSPQGESFEDIRGEISQHYPGVERVIALHSLQAA